MKFLRFSFLPRFVVLIPIFSYSGIKEITNLKKGEDIRNANIIVMDPEYGQAILHIVRDQKVVVSLFHNDIEKIYYPSGWTLEVNYNIELGLPNGTKVNESGILNIDGDPQDLKLDTNIALYNYPNYNYASVTIGTIIFKDGTGSIIPTLPDDFHFEVKLVQNCIYPIGTSPPIVNLASYNAPSNSLEFAWDYIEGAEEYELEYIFIADGSVAGSDHTTSNHGYDFDKATRINLKANTYSLSMPYPKGSLIFRVRGVGYNGTFSNYMDHRQYSNWSYDPTILTINQAFSDNSTNKCAYYFNGLAGNKNWTYTATFAEDGKKKEVIGFADGSGRMRQQVTVNNTEELAIIGESIYDYVGRPAVNILPIPVSSQGLKFYGTSTVPFNGNWGKANFATDLHLDENNTVLPEPLPLNSNARNYYSTNNSLECINGDAIPDAEGYPYSITHYLNDGTDRPHILGAPGGTLRYKAQNSNNTKFYYGSPTQTEVDRLFGNEAGWAEFYKKNIVIDPNGQQSVQYIDMRGRTVATALAGDNPSTLDTIGDKRIDIISSPILQGKDTSNTGGKIVDYMDFTSSSLDPVTINYGLDEYFFTTCRQATSTASGFLPVSYDVELEVKNSRGEIVVDTAFYNISEFSDNVALTFNPGFDEYTITRTIEVNEISKNMFLDMEADTLEYFKLDRACKPFYWIGDTLCKPLDCDTACLEAHMYNENDQWFYTDTAGNVYTSLQSDSLTIYMLPDSAQTWQLNSINSPFYIATEICKEQCLGYTDSSGNYDMYLFYKEDRCSMKKGMLTFDLSKDGQYQVGNCDTTYCYDLTFLISQVVNGPMDSVIISITGDTIYTLPLYDVSVADNTLCSSSFIPDINFGGPDTWIDFYFSDGSYFQHDFVGIQLVNTSLNCDTTAGIGSIASLNEVNQLLDTVFTSWEEFYNNWQSGFENQLLQLHPEFCAYDFFCNYKEVCSSTTLTMDDINQYAGIMHLPEDYSSSLNYIFTGNGPGTSTAYNIMNPLGFPSVSASGGAASDQHTYMQSGGVHAMDPLKSCHQNDTNYLTGYVTRELTKMLQNFLPVVDHLGNTIEVSPGQPAYYSVWYVLDDPDGIADVNNNNYYGQLDSSIIAIFNGLHGDGSCATPAIVDNNSKLLYFKSIYTFLREKTLYDYFDNKYECPGYPPSSPYYTFWDADTNYDGTLDNGTGYVLNYPRNPLYKFYQTEHAFDSINITVQQYTDGNAANMAVSILDTMSCSKFMEYLDLKGYDTTTISVPYTHSVAIANLINADFCQSFNAGVIDSILLCATGQNFVYTNYLPDSLRVSPAIFFVQEAQESCNEQKTRLAKEAALDRWLREKSQYLDSLKGAYELAAYGALKERERISLDYTLGEYHYTLYYYDQGGNLVKTIPPSGVDILSQSETGVVQAYRNGDTSLFIRPAHEYITNYRFNSQNQIIQQWTPDGGLTSFWYDNAARLVLSQNAKQFGNNQYSYTIYDGVGRIAESGQITQLNAPTTDTTGNAEDFKKWLLGGARDQVTFTRYDLPISALAGTGTNEQDIDDAFGIHGQKYLKNRVASIFYVPAISQGQLLVFNNDIATTIPSGYLTYESATHFSYDPHGNVDILIQDFKDPVLTSVYRRFFKMEYEYDLISGNVKLVKYQRRMKDQFYHRYEYDADNRIVSVETSKNGMVWEKDAGYYYYPHEPLSRAEIGDMNIQGSDYAYTLQGWLKVVNGSSLGVTKAFGTYDLGADAKDGNNLNLVFTPDAFGFQLDYFSGDYSSIGSDNHINQISGGGNALNTGFKDLYNGNIGRMTTVLNNNVQDALNVMPNNYSYDQLNRITALRSFKDDDLNTDNSSTANSSSYGYKANYFYDPNGNIKTLSRYDSTFARFDSLSYTYDLAGTYKTNKLLHVDDHALLSLTDDLTDQLPNNYSYDEIGNLISDVQEGITAITWNLQGKVKQISKSGGHTITFKYGPSGNRIYKKHVQPAGTTTTYYVRDASGNVMAAYKHTGTYLTLEELHIYGSDRIGLIKRQETISGDVAFNGNGMEYIPVDDRAFVDLYPTSGSVTIHNTGVDDLLTTLTAIDDTILIPISGEIIVVSGIYDTIGSNWVITSGNHFTIESSSDVTISGNNALSVQSLRDDIRIEGFEGLYLLGSGNYFDRQIGHKRYELKNHLGNVLATVSDRKVWEEILINNNVFNTQFSQEDDLEIWEPSGDIEPKVIEGVADIFYNAPESGIYTEVVIDPSCSYSFCFDILELSDPITITILDENGKTVLFDDRIRDPSQYCWDLTTIEELKSGVLTISLTSQVGSGSFIVDNIVLESTCSEGIQVADVISAQDYYPFGMVMPGRKFVGSEKYRYGFQSQERTDEISGSGNHYSAEYWEYDPRLGRRWNVDPVVKHNESPYAAFANNPIWFIDPSGADTTISGSVTAQSEIMKVEGDPDFVPAGVKLESTAQIDAKIVNGKFTQATADVTPKEFESPVLWGLDPAFTEVRNQKTTISEDGLTATISYDVQTQLSNFEVVGQWVGTLFDDGTIQTNVITVTQSVEIILKIGSITTTFDGSTFPESRYSATYGVDTETKMLKGTVNATLKQSSYYDAVKSATFRERNHPQKTKKTLTY